MASRFLTGFFTLLAGFLASLHSPRLQRAHLEHDSYEKALDREHETKRGVYLNLMSAHAELVSELGNIQNQDVDHAAFPRILSKFSNAISKAQLVASADTHKIITDITLKINQNVKDITPYYFKFIELKVHIKSDQEWLDRVSAEKQSLVNRMRAINVEGPPNGVAMVEELHRQFEQDEELRKEISDRLDKNQRELYECQLSWFKVLSEAQSNASETFRSLLLSIRDELGLENPSVFVDQLRDSAKTARQANEDMIASIDKLVQDSFNEANS